MDEAMSQEGMCEANRGSWNEATVAHNSHKRDQAGFLRRGGSTLFPEEIELLGDLNGKQVVHLQCNAGQDTLSLAKRGAIVTGVDISDEAIAFAVSLSAESGIPACFHRADLYDWFDGAIARQERFDIAFCSYGALSWLPDLNRWAAGVSNVLVPGGRFVTVEFHPVSMMFNERLELTHSYFSEGKPLVCLDGVEDYVAQSGPALAPSGFTDGLRDFKNAHTAYEFQWDIGTIIGALLRAGLMLERFEEYAYANGARFFENMREAPGRRMFLPEQVPSLPLMFGLTARKRDVV